MTNEESIVRLFNQVNSLYTQINKNTSDVNDCLMVLHERITKLELVIYRDSTTKIH